MSNANEPDLRPEETVDRLEEEALNAEAPESKDLADSDREPGKSDTEPAFEQDLDVEDLPGQDGGGASEPAD